MKTKLHSHQEATIAIAKIPEGIYSGRWKGHQVTFKVGVMEFTVDAGENVFQTCGCQVMVDGGTMEIETDDHVE